jgi:hypothetical protein
MSKYKIEYIVDSNYFSNVGTYLCRRWCWVYPDVRWGEVQLLCHFLQFRVSNVRLCGIRASHQFDTHSVPTLNVMLEVMTKQRSKLSNWRTAHVHNCAKIRMKEEWADIRTIAAGVCHLSLLRTSFFFLWRIRASDLVSFQNKSENYQSYRKFVGSLRRGISPSQGHCLHRTTQWHRKSIHLCLECDSNPRSQCSNGRKQFVPMSSAIAILNPWNFLRTFLKWALCQLMCIQRG